MFRQRKLKSKAETLVKTCQSLAVSSYDEFAVKSLLVAQLERDGTAERWDIIVTVAAVGTAMNQVESYAEGRDIQSFFGHLGKELLQWNSTGPELLEHLTEFVQRMSSNGMAHPTAVGSWVISNVKGDAPTDEDLQISPQVGQYLSVALTGWWGRIV